MKKCSTCGCVLPISEFRIKSSAKGWYHAACKACFIAYSRAYYAQNSARYMEHRARNKPRYVQANRERILEFLSRTHCADCDESDPIVLEFDHVRGEKIANVSEMVGQCFSWRKIFEEIQKCEVRCANCHRRKTAGQFKWFKLG